MSQSWIPEPRRGGTFLCCPWRLEEPIPGGVRVTWCASHGGWRPTRFRRLAAFRRHWRRYHASDAPWSRPGADVAGDVREVMRGLAAP